MKRTLLITAALLAGALQVRADVEVTMKELQRIGLLPKDKEALRPEDSIDTKRPNPFAERKKVVQNKPSETVETEESKIRNFFDQQKIGGIMKTPDGFEVALGRLVLKEGMRVPPVIPAQTQILRVTRVTDKLVEVSWVEGVGLEGAVPRKISKPIDLAPKVHQLLSSDEGDSADSKNLVVIDADGKFVTPRAMLPNPSEIIESLPPNSDSNPESALTPDEQAQLNAEAAPPLPPPGAKPDAPGMPPLDPEDKVTAAPDLAPPPTDEPDAEPPSESQ